MAAWHITNESYNQISLFLGSCNFLSALFEAIIEFKLKLVCSQSDKYFIDIH